jgi:hypothetical protein
MSSIYERLFAQQTRNSKAAVDLDKQMGNKLRLKLATNKKGKYPKINVEPQNTIYNDVRKEPPVGISADQANLQNRVYPNITKVKNSNKIAKSDIKIGSTWKRDKKRNKKQRKEQKESKERQKKMEEAVKRRFTDV